MATTQNTNGTHTNTATSGGKVQFDPNFTANVVRAMGPKTSPRMREVMSKLIPHLHDFAREVELTVDEWMEGVMLMAWAGQMTNDKRNEVQLVCDVVGLESLVDEITYKKASEAEGAATESAILGPFFRTDRPTRRNGESIHITKGEGAVDVYMYGRVVDNRTGLPLVGASVDLWQASTNGMYEQQDSAQVEHNLRGKFVTDENGEYACYLIKPTPYPVPFDGPAGKLLQLMDRHPYRPAHIHIIAQKEGYEPLTTQIYDSESDYLDNDSVFAVKDSLVVKFDPRPNDPQASWELHYDVRLAPSDPAKSRL
ncbi:Catechol 1,2-dioxygenase [Pseudocercospora fuligena]|uniref:Catechol 1,2-dioxygenase n=1 Tax=Pseudocercospora fuligena TaxID=685502 RepID=A0A8H6R8H0_9PEZI|nr:Catechol 1,2-dioxygenase [Pseudocercospora fuligena]